MPTLFTPDNSPWAGMEILVRFRDVFAINETQNGFETIE